MMDEWGVILDWDDLALCISNEEGINFSLQYKHPISGGCVNDAWHISDFYHSYFVKINKSIFHDIFKAEQNGLEALLQTKTFKVPRPVVCGVNGVNAFLVMEYIEFSPKQNLVGMGERLAELHKHTYHKFGWHQNNVIGSTHQSNEWALSWRDFWCEKRLSYQVELAAKNGLQQHYVRLCERLMCELDKFFYSHDPVPSLLHGDLWSGNVAYDADGQPVIFDPACYYGDRETDLAMTELFGGFGDVFYEAYHSIWPIDDGYKVRKKLYNHYHVLNHYNLFGGGYAHQAGQMAEQLLAEVL